MTSFNTFTFAGPPRPVPVLVRSRVMLGGFLNQFGWLFFGFGLIFVRVFTMQSDLTGWLVFRGELETAPGRITASRKTNTSVNETPVWQYTYTFTDADGRTYENTSFKTGGADRTGRDVLIEYPAGRPQTSRIQGMRRAVVGLFGLFPLIFPAVGLCFMSAGLAKGAKAVRLLRDGRLAAGRLIAKEPTRTRVNDRPVYRLTFEFTAFDGRKYQAAARTHLPEKLQDESEEPLLYDPVDPARAVMLDDLPGTPRIDPNGDILCNSPAAALAALLIPAITILAHTAWLYLA